MRPRAAFRARTYRSAAIDAGISSSERGTRRNASRISLIVIGCRNRVHSASRAFFVDLDDKKIARRDRSISVLLVDLPLDMNSREGNDDNVECVRGGSSRTDRRAGSSESDFLGKIGRLLVITKESHDDVASLAREIREIRIDAERKRARSSALQIIENARPRRAGFPFFSSSSSSGIGESTDRPLDFLDTRTCVNYTKRSAPRCLKGTIKFMRLRNAERKSRARLGSARDRVSGYTQLC